MDLDQLDDLLAQVQSEGWCLVDQELEIGLRSVAAPLHDAAGRVVAAMNISTHGSRVSVEVMRDEFVPRLLAAAAEIDERLAKR